MKKLIGIVGVVVLVLSLAAPVMAATEEQVGTTANVGAGAAPYICAKFETPDHDAANGTQILPVAGGDRDVKFYVVTGHPNGDISKIVRVDVTVKYPDGTEKFQLTGIKDMATGVWTGVGGVSVRLIAWSDTTPEIDTDGDCTPDTDITTAMTDLDGQNRVKYGKDHNNVLFDLDSVLYDVKMGKQLMLEFIGQMGHCQPAQNYTVEAVATDDIGSTGVKLVNTFKYLSIVALEVDFTDVDWGDIKAGQANNVLGDTDPTTPTRPSVKNIGNDPGEIQLEYSRMVNANGKYIVDFDGRLGASPYWTIITADDTVSTDARVLLDAEMGCSTLLPPCEWTQLDFSVHPPVGTMGGIYTGTVKVTILHRAPCP